MSSNLLEPEFAPHFNEWQAAKTPEANAKMLTHLQPAIDSAINAHIGTTNPLLVSRGRKMALDALRTYDPSRSRLKTHLFNQLQGLKRVNRQQSSIIRMPERIALDRYHLGQHTQELTDTLGRDPSDEELADHTGFSMKRIKHVRSRNPGIAEGTLESANPEGQHEVYGGVDPVATQKRSAWVDLVHSDLAPTDQIILEHAIGYNGKRQLSNEEIATKIKRSPGLVSQRKKVIQSMLDKQDALSPF